MIAACPTCSTRYRVENERLKGEGLRLRCTRCQTVFRVRPPAVQPAPAAPAPPQSPVTGTSGAPPAPPPEPMVSAQHTGVSFGNAAPPAGAPAPPAAVAPAPPASDPWVMAELTPSPRPADRTRLVLVADSDVEAGKELAGALAQWGLEALLAHDGVEAILAIQRSLPAAVVLDAALPKMFGFQVCELMKRNTELRAIKVVLIGAIHHRDRYRRPPQEIYGADAYLERPELFHGLGTVLRDFGLPLERPAPTPTPRPPLAGDPPPIARRPAEPVAAPPPPAIAPPAEVARPDAAGLPVAPPAPVAPAAPAAPDPLSDERAKAERLARIIVSDVILYNEEKFARAMARGNVAEAMDGDLEEGRALFRQRIDARVREERDFLSEELLRVARQRAAR